MAFSAADGAYTHLFAAKRCQIIGEPPVSRHLLLHRRIIHPPCFKVLEAAGARTARRPRARRGAGGPRARGAAARPPSPAPPGACARARAARARNSGGARARGASKL